MLVCIGCLVLLDKSDFFAPASRWMYDQAVHIVYEAHWENQAKKAGVYEKRPVLIAIDESSLEIVGRWPWSRSIHAQLLTTLSQGKGASVVAMDIVFSEPQIEGVLSIDTDEDAKFSQAINRSPFPVLLATQIDVWQGASRLIRPREPLSSSAARMAHAQIEVDRDGSVRRYLAVDPTVLGLKLPYLGKAMLTPTQAPLINSPLINSSLTFDADVLASHKELFYPLPKKWIKELSYQSVLSGQIERNAWEGLPVLVAATAQGLGDQYVAHISRSATVIPGGGLVLAAFHTEKLLQAGLPHLSMASPKWHWFSVCLVVSLVFFGLRRSSKISTQLWLVLTSLVVSATVVLFTLALKGVWLNAAEIGFSVILTWMLWTSHAMQRLLRFLLERLHELQRNTTAVEGGAPKLIVLRGEDAIDQQLVAANSLELLRQAELVRLREVLEMLPDAAFVLTSSSLDGTGMRLSVQNLAARQLGRLFPALQKAASQSCFSLNALLFEFNVDLTEQQEEEVRAVFASTFEWQHLFGLRQSVAFKHGVESKNPQNGRYLIKLAYLSKFDIQSSSLSMVLSIVDLSVGLALIEARNRTLNFLSHDLRAPQATILALIELEDEVSPENAALFSKIKFQSQRTLQLAEGFVQLSQASHSATYNMVEYNLNDLMVEALDEQWACAKQQGVALKSDRQSADLWVIFDRNLMWRALVNLINNALIACKCNGQVDGEVCLSVRRDGSFAVVEVRDNGSGMSAEQQLSLFRPFVQGHGLKRTGAGLGLAFVKTVLDQHHGQVRVFSPTIELPEPHGTRFELWLPLMENQPVE